MSPKSPAASRAPWWQLDLSDLEFVYGVLFAFLVVLINPWGTPRGEIWTDPKVYALVAISSLTWAVLLFVALRPSWPQRQAPQRQASAAASSPTRFRLWSVAALLWLAFLTSGLVTVLRSPVSFQVALAPHSEMGDGGIYWAWVAAFTLGNALLLRRFPHFLRAQLYGLLVGGTLLSLAVFAQSVNWKLDFTATMGRTLQGSPVWLQSLIHQGQMPLGFTSNRGHAAFIIAALSVLVLVSLLRGWLRPRLAWPLYAVLLGGLYVTSTRGAQLAFAAGVLYLIVRFWRVQGARKTLAWAASPLLLGVLALGVFGGSQVRNLPSLGLALTNLDAFTSARVSYLWPSAVEGIRARPLFGWGFNGYGLAWPHVNDFEERWATRLARDEAGNAIGVVRVERHNHSHFRYLGEDGNIHFGRVLTNKSHNIILDTAVSVGLIGLVLYGLLFGVCFYAAARGQGYGLEAVGVVYLAFALTWFDSAQYSHLVWWALSAGLGLYALPHAALSDQNANPTHADVEVIRGRDAPAS